MDCQVLEGTRYYGYTYDDESGNAYSSFVYNGTQYYYVKNLQGDVMRIVNATGSVVANYTYDAWGKAFNSGNIVGLYNPIRYRGYYYDTETGFYYLQSRYYDPAIKRFINADDASLFGVNGNFTSLNSYIYTNNITSYSCNSVSKKVISTTSESIIPIYMNIVDLSNTIGGFINKNSKNLLSFSVGLLTPEKYNMPSWMSVYAFYVKGSLGWGYTFGEGYSIASFGIGILNSTFHTPKWFSSLSNDHLANPNIYLGVATWNANVSIGVGVSGIAEIISGTVGIQFGNAISIEVKGYVGIGFTLDLTNGIKFGQGWGLGYEISLNIDWYELFY